MKASKDLKSGVDIVCVQPKPDLAYFSVPQTSIKYTLGSCTVKVGDMFLFLSRTQPPVVYFELISRI